MYTIKIRRYLRGQLGSTRYKFQYREDALQFAHGYQRGLLDINRPDLYVFVCDSKGTIIHDVRSDYPLEEY